MSSMQISNLQHHLEASTKKRKLQYLLQALRRAQGYLDQAVEKNSGVIQA